MDEKNKCDCEGINEIEEIEELAGNYLTLTEIQYEQLQCKDRIIYTQNRLIKYYQYYQKHKITLDFCYGVTFGLILGLTLFLSIWSILNW